MTEDLLKRAEESAIPVRAAALMRIARVQGVADPARGRATFERGFEAVRRIPRQDGEFLVDQARRLAAAVAPDLLAGLPPAGHFPREIEAEQLGKIMVDHGHGDAALKYVMHYDEPASFPFAVVAALMRWFGDNDRRLALFRHAITMWRAHWSDRFFWLFQAEWTILPPDEARDVTREIVQTVRERPEEPITAHYGEGVEVTSMREHHLFQLLHILRRMDEPLAESLIAEYPQLAAAARRYPNGSDSIQEEADRRRSETAGPSCGGFGMAGDPRDFPYGRALLQGSRDGDFAPAVKFALERYREDTDPDKPNDAPKEFWPSTGHFRSILHRAGKRSGREGEVYLDRIPDPDLRLFAEIELEAALAGLPELQGIQRFRTRRKPPLAY